MNNITSSGVCENWNNNISHTNTSNSNHNNPSMVSFVGLQNNNSYKQFWDWETNTQTSTSTTTTSNLNHHNNNNNVNPFMTTQTNFFDYTNLPTLSSTSFNDNNFISPSQFPDYSAAAGFLKKEEDGYGYDDGSYYSNTGGRIGLNLGHRTYFSSRETSLIDRLFRRPRGFYQANQVPRCQAEGCKMDLTNAKHYHRRHKVCELHSKATKVIAGGLEQRFCQQCSRFHVLAEFDQAKRSCRKRLADHNRRRRKPQIGQTDSVPAKTAENVGPPASTSRSEHKEMSLSSSANLPLMISTFTNSNNNHTSKPSTDTSPSSGTQFTSGPALSLGCEDHQDQRQPFIFNQNSADMFHRETSVAPYHNLFTSNSSNHAQHQQDDLQSLLHMRQNLFEVELL